MQHGLDSRSPSNIGPYVWLGSRETANIQDIHPVSGLSLVSDKHTDSTHKQTQGTCSVRVRLIFRGFSNHTIAKTYIKMTVNSDNISVIDINKAVHFAKLVNMLRTVTKCSQGGSLSRNPSQK